MATKITVGVTGGIAAYKAVELVRALQTAGLDPHVVMTRAAEQFVTPLTFAAISGHRVITSLWASEGSESNIASAIDHIDEAQTTQALVVAPATADILARFAHGIADDFLTTLHLATHAPVVVAPAMNVNMWDHPATQANLAILRRRGVQIVTPGSGYLACGMMGNGRLAEIAEIVAAVLEAVRPSARDLIGETILITAGGTREPIDPVRFLGNRSSGKMGYALAATAAERGARVILISAPTALTPPACEFIQVVTAAEMRDAVLAHLPGTTAIIGAAAVSDFRPATVAADKIRRNGTLTLTLESTPDILAEAATLCDSGTLVIAFAAETDSTSALKNGHSKLVRKGVDAIVINDVSKNNQGFDTDHNAAIFLTAADQIDMPAMHKSTMADQILDQLLKLRLSQETASRLQASPQPV